MSIRKIKTDVLVVGAGASGVPAAIAAARTGAKVVLIEEDPVIGGATTDFYVGLLCGEPKTGIIKEAEDILKSEHSLGNAEPLFFLPSTFLWVYTSLLNREKNLQVITGARATDVILENGSGRACVSGVRIENGAGNRITIMSDITIDATGTGAVAILAGCRAMYGRDSKADFNEPHAPREGDDQRSGVLPEDTIAIGTYGLDIWGADIASDERGVPAYGIPYRTFE